MNLEYGATYYQVTYADKEKTMPGIKPLVYIGENLLEGESEVTHYFQDTTSVQLHGLWQSSDSYEECLVTPCKARYIGVDIVSIESTVSVVEQAANRAKELGYPKLKKGEGNWS